MTNTSKFSGLSGLKNQKNEKINSLTISMRFDNFIAHGQKEKKYLVVFSLYNKLTQKITLHLYT